MSVPYTRATITNSNPGKFSEGDVSATREDFYLNGDNISFQPKLFKQLHRQALAKGDGTYNVDAVKEHFKNRYRDSKATNKQFCFNAPSAVVVIGAYYFVPGFFSNGTIQCNSVKPNCKHCERAKVQCKYRHFQSSCYPEDEEIFNCLRDSKKN